jgi:membrane associated rhomboid family serine protease
VIPLRDNVPTRHFPVLTVGLIAANVLVWLWEVTGTPFERDVFEYGYYPCAVEGPCVSPGAGVPAPDPEPLPVMAVSSMFMHGSWIHIIGNMLFLWIFGNNVEDAMGRVKFLVFYLLSGLAATATQTWVTLQFATAEDASIPNIGASGAVAGVLGAYLLLLPGARVLTAFILGFFFFLREIPALFFLGIWFLFQLIEGGFSITHPQSGGGVAFFAHIGGFVFGMVAVYLFAGRRRPLRPSY